MIYVGIDPGEGKGKAGAIAIADKESCFEICDCPLTEEAMADILLSYPAEELHVMLEKAPKIIKMGTKTLHPTVLYGNFRAWKGILATLNVVYKLKYDIVHPRTWQTILPTNKKLSTKERAMEMALRLYPEAKQWLTGPRGAQKYDRSDALIILEYGKRIIWR